MAPLPNTSDPGGICCPRRSIAMRWGIDSSVGPKLQVRSGPLNGWVGPGRGIRLPDERLSLNNLTKPSGVQRCLRPRRPLLRRAGLQIVGMGQEGRDNGGDERGMQERLHRAGALGVDLVQAMDGLVQLDAQFHLPADPVEIGHLPGAEARWELGEKKAIALRRVDPNQAEMERVPEASYPHIGIDGPAVKPQDFL